MQYVARSQMQYLGADGVMRHVSPGDALPEFASWPYILRIAHLDEGTVEEVGAQYRANLDISNGYLSYETRSGTPRELIDHVSEPALDVTLEPIEAVEVDVVDKVEAAAGTYPCSQCEKVYYRPSRLAQHVQKHH